MNHGCLGRRMLLLAALSFASTVSLARDPFTFVPAFDERGFSLSTEVAFGSREAGGLGSHGVEELARGRYASSGPWVTELTLGGVANRDSHSTQAGLSLESRYAGFGHGLQFGAGYRREYDRVNVPYLRMMWVSSARYPTGFSALVEFPRVAERDPADLMIGFAQAFPCGAALDCTFEIAGEDLEGFVEEEEAEGGARLVVGPTVTFAGFAVHPLKLFCGWIYAATNNTPLRPDYQSGQHGALVRAAMRF